MANSIRMMTANSNLFVISLQDKGEQDQQGLVCEIKIAEDEETHMITLWFTALLTETR